jgi:hypothetical protein
MSVDSAVPIISKPYEQPTLRKLTAEQFKILLWENASVGNEDAKELLKIFPESSLPTT